MTWRIDDPQGHESAKIASIAVPYLQGRFLDLGCGMAKVWPSAIGMDNGHHFGGASAGIAGDVTDLSMFTDESMDAVFSSHCLEHFERERVPAVLAEWARVLKIGGYLVLYVPSANLYPRMGERGANPDHKWDIEPGDVERMLRDSVYTDPSEGEFYELDSCGHLGAEGNWTLLESEERSGTNEYSLFIVVRKEAPGHGWSEDVWQRNPDGKQRALVARFGAIGDHIIAAAVLPGLKRQGFHVTYMTTPFGKEVLEHDPNIDEWIVQAKDFVPNEELGPYWESVATRYDRFVNLSESIEGALLTLPGRLTHGYSDETRRRLFGTVNYLQRTADLAGVELRDCRPRFHATDEETEWALELRRSHRGAPVIAWAIHGSSPHKVYPWTKVVVAWLLKQTPAHVYLLADDKIGRDLQDGIIAKLAESGADMKRVHGLSGQWPIRKALAFCQVANCVVGPETGPLNAVSHEAMPKVIYLSHSSNENLTRDWVNTVVLEPERECAPCFPCHRLHADWTYCPQSPETGAALCASGITPMRVFEAIAFALGARRAA